MVNCKEMNYLWGQQLLVNMNMQIHMTTVHQLLVSNHGMVAWWSPE